MRLKSVSKLGVGISITLFIIAVILYCFGGFNIPKVNKEFNLYSVVPSDAVCVVESDNINFYFNELSHLSYSSKLDSIRGFELANFILGALNDYTSNSGHGLNSRMGHMIISAHDSGDSDNQVLYFYTEEKDAVAMDKMLDEYISSTDSPLEEKFMDNEIYKYPLGDKTLSIYRGENYRALSFNNGLIKNVIECKKNKTSILYDRQFMKVRDNNQSHNYLTLYSKSPVCEFINGEKDMWTRFNFLINSDVIYLTGEIPLNEDGTAASKITSILGKTPGIYEDSLIISADTVAMHGNLEKIYQKRNKGQNTLFDECVANVSQDASFMMVADVDKLILSDDKYKSFVLPFIWNNKNVFSDFILSTQLSLSQNNLMQVFILTYKG